MEEKHLSETFATTDSQKTQLIRDQFMMHKDKNHSNVKFVTTVAHKTQHVRDIMKQYMKDSGYSLRFLRACLVFNL